MLCANSMPRSHDAALQERERGLNRIGVNVTLHVDMGTVPNDLVAASLADIARRLLIGLEVICIKYFHVIADILLDVFCERASLNILSVKKSEFAPALTNADHDFFVVPTMLFAFVSVLAADESFVHFDFAAEGKSFDLRHCRPDAMAEIPRGFVSLDSKGALNLARAHALLGLDKQLRSEKPAHKGQMRIVEDRTDRYAELVLA